MPGRVLWAVGISSLLSLGLLEGAGQPCCSPRRVGFCLLGRPHFPTSDLPWFDLKCGVWNLLLGLAAGPALAVPLITAVPLKLIGSASPLPCSSQSSYRPSWGQPGAFPPPALGRLGWGCGRGALGGEGPPVGASALLTASISGPCRGEAMPGWGRHPCSGETHIPIPFLPLWSRQSRTYGFSVLLIFFFLILF